jgi:HAD superfamily hydrolase (TIGR01509 family)
MPLARRIASGYDEGMTIPADADRAHLIPMPIDFVPAGAIFDCDGTLADTMPLHYRAWRQTLDAYGLPHVFPEEQFYAWGGVTAVEIMRRLNEQHGLSVPPEEAAHRKEATYSHLIPYLTPIGKVLDEARRLHGKCPLAIASGGMHAVVEETLRTLGIRDLFAAVATADDVARGKPEPDVFLLAAERMGVPASGCVVYEDAPAGIEAARRAGMKAVNVLDYL